MVCTSCGTTYCRCKNKECPTCAEAAKLGQVLVEYRGNQPRYSLHGYNWRQANRRAYVQGYDVPKITADPNLVVVSGVPA